MKPEHSRREFLEQMGIGTAGLLTGGYTAKAAGFPQNETIQIGIIGAGGRARQLMQRLAAMMRYPEQGLQLHFEGTFVNQHHKAMVELMGEDATLYLDRGRMELHPEPGRKVEAREVILGGARGGDFSTIDGETLHLNDWLEAVRSRRPPSAPAEAGVLAAKVAHLGNQAYRESTIVRTS